MNHRIRAAEPGEVTALAQVWFEGWHDAHARIVPSELARWRTSESFAERLMRGLAQVRAIGPVGAPLGFYMLKGDELNQLFVARAARGTGVAAALLVDAEARLADGGVDTAWLSCAIGNQRAARFYEKSGWHNTGTHVMQLETGAGPFDLELWRFEKRLGQ